MRIYSPMLERESECHPTPWSQGGWQVVRCGETDLVFLANPPSFEQLSEEFAWEKSSRIERQRRADKRPMLDRLSGLSKSMRRRFAGRRNKTTHLLQGIVGQRAKSSVLDIGCGSGHLMLAFTDLMSRKGQTVVPCGLEISKQLAEQARGPIEARGGKVVQSAAVHGLSAWDDGEVDTVMMISYLEHEAQPLAVLREIKRVLKPDGQCLLKVPNFACWNRRIRGRQWCGFRYPDHVNYFTPSTLREACVRGGLQFSQAWSDRTPLSDNMYAILTAQEPRDRQPHDPT